VLERGFAHHSLQHNLQDDQPTVEAQDTDTAAFSPEECAMDDADDIVDSGQIPRLLPDSIEEPEQDIPEIQMKTSSWYELAPDRK
jgi:hypothetical protein